MLGPEVWPRVARALEIMERLYANIVRVEP